MRVDHDGQTPVTTPEAARAIFGVDMLRLEEVSKHFRVRITASHRVRFEQVPFSEAVLEQSKGTHMLMAGFPLSILDVRGRARRNLFQPRIKDWYDREAFATMEKVDLRWYLLGKGIIPGSLGKSFGDQLSLLGPFEEVPKACEVVYQVILYSLARGIRLFENTFTRSRDVLREGWRVGVGGFQPNTGLQVIPWDEHADPDIGISGSWKPAHTQS